MPSSKHIPAIRSTTILAAMAFTLTLATQAQTNSLPDAPTPSNAVLASLSPQPDLTFFTADPLQQSTSQPPAQNPAPPSLSDLGLTPDQTKADPDAQARLDRRTHMLKIHQKLGLLTTIPIAAACISSAGATPDRNSYGNTTSRDVHVGIAGLAIGMYGATAYYAIRAPRIPDSGPARGGIKIHKYLIWIHAPGMILTPILGTMAFNDIAGGHKPGGIEQYHSAVALTTAIAYAGSIVAVSWPIHMPFTGSK